MSVKRILAGSCILILCLTMLSCARESDHLTGTPVLKVALQSGVGDSETAPTKEYYILDDEGHAEKQRNSLRMRMPLSFMRTTAPISSIRA